MTTPQPTARIENAEVVVPCVDFAAVFSFFTEQLGFTVNLIFPADSPSTAVVSGLGITLRLEALPESAATPTPVTFRLQCENLVAANALVIPAGIRIIFVPKPTASTAKLPLAVPKGKPEFVLSVAAKTGQATTAGRAGMIYRDLIPTRLGGRFVASLITIPDGGMVPDYVHFHRVVFQMIFCKSGWVRVVYEGQGEPFVLHAGDCVLQPPEIRHRVLEASVGLEVIELGCPAVHDTVADATLTLPAAAVTPNRSFNGQRFARHVAKDAKWKVWRENCIGSSDFEATDMGIAAATNNLAAVNLLRLHAGTNSSEFTTSHQGEILFFFVLAGELRLTLAVTAGAQIEMHVLKVDDSVVVPAGVSYTLCAVSRETPSQEGFLLLRVAL